MRTAFLVAAATWLAVSAAAQESTELVQRRVGRAAVLAHSAEQAWLAARADRSAGAESERRLLALAGASRVVADRLSSGGSDADRRALVTDLEALAGDVQRALDRTRPGADLQRAWTDARRALAALADLSAPGYGEPPPPPEPPRDRLERPTDPDAPVAEITETRWSGAFTPDLVVTGRFTGERLVTAELVVLDASGREVHSVTDGLVEALRSAQAGRSRSERVSAEWSVRIDDDDLATGENTIRVTVEDARGREATAETRLTKRLF